MLGTQRILATAHVLGAMLAEFARDVRGRSALAHVRCGAGVRIRGWKRIRAGRDCFIDHGAYLNPSIVAERRGRIVLGDRVEIGPACVIWGGGGVTIGDDVHLGAGVHVTSQWGHFPPNPAALERPLLVVDVAPVRIDACAIIYSGAIVAPGVHIGRNAIVAAGAVVLEDVAQGGFVAGVPARPVRRRGLRPAPSSVPDRSA